MESPVLLAMILWLPCIAGEINNNCTENVCMTNECISVAHDILESLDESIYPCQDFYQYACGGWMHKQMLQPDEKTRTPYLSELPFVSVRKMIAKAPRRTDLGAVKKAKNMYISCVRYAKGTSNYKAIARVVNATFGRWPLTCDNCTMDGFHLEQFLFEAIQLGVHPLFTLAMLSPSIVRFISNVTQRLLTITNPELGFPINQYAKLSKKHTFRNIYAHKIYSVAKYFGADNYERALNESKEIVQVETLLAEMHNTFAWSRSLYSLNLTTLDHYYGKLLNWTSFVTRLELFQSMNSSMLVFVEYAYYLHHMTDYFSQLPARTQANYIIWRVIDSLQSVTIDEQKKLNTLVLQTVNGDKRVPLPEEACARYVSKAFHLAGHRLLYDAHLPGNKLDTLNLMIDSLHREFDALLDEHVLVNLTDLQIIREKNNAINTVLTFHLHAMNDSFLESYYSNVTIDRHHFIKNVVEMGKDTFAKKFSYPLEGFETADPPYQFHAGYIPRLNIIEINSVIAQPPGWVDNVPASFNFGRTGELIGHELMHGAFTGHVFDKHGIQGAWWNHETVVYFEDRYRCLADQYSTFFNALAGLYVNGNFTLHENVADNAGLKLAYRAYINYTKSGIAKEQQFPGLNLSNEQIFFLAFAQMQCTVESKQYAIYKMEHDGHSPQEFRVIGTLQNSREFANAFNCSVGSRMNPATKCQPW